MNEGQLHERVGEGLDVLDVAPAAEEGSEHRGAMEAAREAEQRELDASALAAQVQQSLYAYRMTLGVAGQAIERVIAEAIAISMLLTWSPGREEEIEMDRRKVYGKDYVGKEKPSGELFEERQKAMRIDGHGQG